MARKRNTPHKSGASKSRTEEDRLDSHYDHTAPMIRGESITSDEAVSAKELVKGTKNKPEPSRSVLWYILLPLLPLRWLLWMLFGRRRKDTDIEETLKHLSKEEVNVHTRRKRRTATWRRWARNIMLYSAVLEVSGRVNILTLHA